jgi:hypothetical protein
VRSGALPVEGDVEPIIGQEAAGALPILCRLGVANRFLRAPVLGEPVGRRTVQGG